MLSRRTLGRGAPGAASKPKSIRPTRAWYFVAGLAGSSTIVSMSAYPPSQFRSRSGGVNDLPQFCRKIHGDQTLFCSTRTSIVTPVFGGQVGLNDAINSVIGKVALLSGLVHDPLRG